MLTREETHSASFLINRYLDLFSAEANAFLADFRTRYSADDIVEMVRSLRGLRVLAVGEAIVDEYEFCVAMAKANKDPHIAARFLSGER